MASIIIAGMATMRLTRHLAVGGLTLLVWALAAGSAAWWLLRLGERPQDVAAPVADDSSAGALAVDEQAVARALGAIQAPTAPSGGDADVVRRLALHGVLTHGVGGAALIAVDGQAARTVRVDARVEGLEGDWVLRAVWPHAVALASGAREVRLEMPPADQRRPASAPVPAQPPRPRAPTLTAPPAVMPPVPGLADGPARRMFPPREASPRPGDPRGQRERR